MLCDAHTLKRPRHTCKRASGRLRVEIIERSFKRGNQISSNTINSTTTSITTATTTTTTATFTSTNTTPDTTTSIDVNHNTTTFFDNGSQTTSDDQQSTTVLFTTTSTQDNYNEHYHKTGGHVWVRLWARERFQCAHNARVNFLLLAQDVMQPAFCSGALVSLAVSSARHLPPEVTHTHFVYTVTGSIRSPPSQTVMAAAPPSVFFFGDVEVARLMATGRDAASFKLKKQSSEESAFRVHENGSVVWYRASAVPSTHILSVIATNPRACPIKDSLVVITIGAATSPIFFDSINY